MLRLMLAILHTVFYYVDENGDKSQLDDDNVMERWAALWEMGRLPETPIRTYFKKWRDRFYLFDDKYPFYQVPEAEKGTEHTAAKLNGVLSESSNKLRLFSGVSGEQKSRLTYSEAARWLLYVNGFDDTSAKPKEKDSPSPGAGWLGKLGLIYVAGNNLFETLMLNLVLVDNDTGGVWQGAKPAWEREKPRSRERTCIAPTDDQAELLTLQSRRLLLKWENDAVTGYYLLGGDFFSDTNVPQEQMTLWRSIPGKGKKPGECAAKRHDSSRQLWRDFGAVFDFTNDESNRRPGVVRWNKRLNDDMDWPSDRILSFKIAVVQYGDKDFFINDTFADELAFRAGIIGKIGKTGSAG